MKYLCHLISIWKWNKFYKRTIKIIDVGFQQKDEAKEYQVNSDEYKNKMMTDSYLNCYVQNTDMLLPVHKRKEESEWGISILRRVCNAMDQAELFRWWYTCSYKSAKYLHLTNEWWIE